MWISSCPGNREVTEEPRHRILDYIGRQLGDYEIIREIGSGSPKSYSRFFLKFILFYFLIKVRL